MIRDLPPLPVAMAGLVALAVVVAAGFAPWLASSDPTLLSSLDLANAEIPPAWIEGGEARHPLGTDNQGRDLVSAILYGARVSIAIGVASVLVSATLGVTLGLLAGYLGGWVDALVSRVGDVIMSFPTILLALLVSGLARALIPDAASATWTPLILVGAIAVHEWVQYARTVRAATMVERARD